jgi:hypothetical protein
MDHYTWSLGRFRLSHLNTGGRLKQDPNWCKKYKKPILAVPDVLILLFFVLLSLNEWILTVKIIVKLSYHGIN